jgi:hypothetical protein
MEEEEEEREREKLGLQMAEHVRSPSAPSLIGEKGRACD